MLNTLDKGRPICPQIYEQICVGIAGGEFSPNQRLLSVRELAVELGVNPNTVKRAFDLLEADGILYSVRSSGWFVSEDTRKAKEVLDRIIGGITEDYFNKMSALGIDTEGAKAYAKEWNNG